jgi:hypothetical protein
MESQQPFDKEINPRVVGAPPYEEVGRYARWKKATDSFLAHHHASYTENNLEYLSEENKALLEDIEVPASPEQISIISVAVQVADELSRLYGGKPQEISIENIHFVDTTNASESSCKIIDNSRGFTIGGEALIVIDLRLCRDNVLLASTILHELLHVKSFHSFGMLRSENSSEHEFMLSGRRTGMAAVHWPQDLSDASLVYGSGINEIATEIIQKDLFPELLKKLKERLPNSFAWYDSPSAIAARRHALESEPELEGDLITTSLDPETGREVAVPFAYETHRSFFLNIVVPDILEAFPSIDRKGVIESLKKAYFSGAWLDFARLVTGAYNNTKAFRVLLSLTDRSYEEDPENFDWVIYQLSAMKAEAIGKSRSPL